MDKVDPYNVLLVIATNIHVLLMCSRVTETQILQRFGISRLNTSRSGTKNASDCLYESGFIKSCALQPELNQIMDREMCRWSQRSHLKRLKEISLIKFNRIQPEQSMIRTMNAYLVDSSHKL